jgi:putative hydrolase of the HAD superfamily
VKGTRTRALVVDLFGTLVPKWSTELSMAARRRMAGHVGVEERAFHDAWGVRWQDRELGRIGPEENLFEIVQQLAPAAGADAVMTLLGIWTGFVREQLRPRPEALLALEAARAAGLRIALASNAGPTVPPLFLETPLARLVDRAVFSCTLGVAKPDARFYAGVSEELGVPAEACVYVGDGADNELQGARSAGMIPVLLRIDSEIELEGLPPGAAAWSGPVIRCFADIREHLPIGWPAGPSGDARAAPSSSPAP